MGLCPFSLFSIMPHQLGIVKGRGGLSDWYVSVGNTYIVVTMPNMRREEERVLQHSVYVDISYAAVTLGIGYVIQSQTVLFDGLFSLISVILSAATLLALKFMNQADWEQFPYGKSTIEPLVVIIRYLALLALVIGSVVAAIVTIVRGGQEILIDVGLAYAGFAVVTCFAMTIYLRRKNKHINSAFLRSDIAEWYLDGLVSIGVVGGFGLAWVMQRVPELAPFVVYVDPVMMLVFSLFFVKGPINEIRRSLREVLDMRPTGKLADRVERIVRETGERHHVQETFVRITKVSKTLWVEIDYVVGSTTNLQTIDEQDALREELLHALPWEEYQIWLTLSLTNDRKWAL